MNSKSVKGNSFLCFDVITEGCVPSDCSLIGSNPDTPCNDDEGICNCREGYAGDTCSDCADGYYKIGNTCNGNDL